MLAVEGRPLFDGAPTAISGLVLDGAYLVSAGPPAFRWTPRPSEEELRTLVERIAERVGRPTAQGQVRTV